MNKRKGSVLNLSKGFTIIELIVVIAIIAILAAIILANVSTYNVRSKDAAAKGDLSTLTTAGTKYYEANGSNYNNFFTAANPDWVKINGILTSVNMNYTITQTCDQADNCNAGTSDTKWCASVKLKQYSTATYYCVDSVGEKKQSTTAICAAGVCPN